MIMPRSPVPWLTTHPSTQPAEASSAVGPFWGEGKGGGFCSVRSLDWYKERSECWFKASPVKTAPDKRLVTALETALKLTLVSCRCSSALKDAWKKPASKHFINMQFSVLALKWIWSPSLAFYRVCYRHEKYVTFYMQPHGCILRHMVCNEK